MRITFEPIAHEYRDESGLVLPSVTQVLRPLMDDSHFDEYSRDRGTLVHRATAMDDEGTLDEASLDPVLVPYVQAWRQFRLDSGFAPWAVEQIVFNEAFRYAGTLDRIGRIGPFDAVADIKTGSIQPWTGSQTAAYANCLTGNYRRYGIELRADGKYSVMPFEDRNDWPLFLACLQVHNWKRNHGIKETHGN